MFFYVIQLHYQKYFNPSGNFSKNGLIAIFAVVFSKKLQ